MLLDASLPGSGVRRVWGLVPGLEASMAAVIHLVLWCAVGVAGALLWHAGAGGPLGPAVGVGLIAGGLWAGWRSRRAARRRRTSLQYVQMAKQPIALG